MISTLPFLIMALLFLSFSGKNIHKSFIKIQKLSAIIKKRECRNHFPIIICKIYTKFTLAKWFMRVQWWALGTHHKR